MIFVALDSPRDFVHELATACREADLLFFLYVALDDAQWRHDLLHRYPDDLDACLEAWVERQGAHMRELVERYRPDGLWLDGWPYHVSCYKAVGLDARATVDFDRLLSPVRALDEGILVGNKELRDSVIDFLESEVLFEDHFGQPLCQTHPVEVCDYLPGGIWFARHREETDFLNAADLDRQARLYTQRLATCLASGANYLLNVAPLPSGALQSPEVAILQTAGQWLHSHDTTLRGQGLAPAGEGDWGYALRRGQNAYLHILDNRGMGDARGQALPKSAAENLKTGLPNNAPLILPPALGQVEHAEVFDTGQPVPLLHNSEALDTSGMKDDPVDLVVSLKLSKSGDAAPPRRSSA